MIAELGHFSLVLALVLALVQSTVPFAGALRGAGDTNWVMRASVILHWIFAVIAVVLIRVVVAPPVLVWTFFIAFVLSLGVTMVLRFRGGVWKSKSVIEGV